MPRISRSLVIYCALALTLGLVMSTRAERLPVRVFTSADGLGSSFVDYLMRDSRGFLWFATRDGLSRYDGSEFVTYHIGESNSPPGIEMIYETRSGDYWISTTGGTYCFRSRTATLPKAAANHRRPVLPAEFVTVDRGAIVESRDGRLWFVKDKLFLITESDGKFILTNVPLNLPESMSRFSVSDFHDAPDGSLWMNSTVGVLRRLVDGRVIRYLPANAPTEEAQSLIDGGMLVEANGRVWISQGLSLDVIQPETAESLSHAGPVTERKLPTAQSTPARFGQPTVLPTRPGETLHFTGGDFLTQHVTKRLFQTADGHVWLTTERELIEFDGTAFHGYSVAQGLPSSMLRMTEDLAGNLWIGGQTGLTRLDRHSLRTYTEADGLSSNNVQAIAEAPDGSLYFANGDFFLSRLLDTGLQSVRPNIPKTSAARWTSRYAMIDSRGDRWILTREKLYRFSPTDLDHPAATYTDRDGLKVNEMFQIFEDRAGAIWVSQQPLDQAEGRGLSRLLPGETKFYSFTEAEGFPAKRSPSSFAEDGVGNLWIAFYEGGLARYANGRFTYFDQSSGLPPQLITDLLVDRGGRLWIASALDGLYRLDDVRAQKPSFFHLGTDQGLASDNVRTLAEDKLGNIYVGTVRGVDRIAPDGVRIKHFSVSDGLAGDFVVDSHCDRNGVVWFATTSGLSSLIPAADEPRESPAVWLGGLRVAGIAQPISALGQRTIALPDLTHTQNTVQVDFFGLDFRPGERLRYEYKLEGSGSDWSAPTDQRTVTLANLQPGNYRFLVRAINSDAQTSAELAVVTFRIRPPFWLRWWFLALCAAAVIATILIFYRYRMARLREVNSALQAANRASEGLRRVKEERLAELELVRSRIATDLHDDIGSSLTQIAILSEVAQRRSGTGSEGDAQSWQQISQTSNDLVGKMGDIVWAINPHKDHLSDLTQRMRRFASDVLSAKGIDLEFAAPPFGDDLALGANVRREVFLIFKESINNIVKHAKAASVVVHFTVMGPKLQLTIADDGCGFVGPPAGTEVQANLDSGNPGGTGLHSIQRRAKELGGELDIASQPGHGTTLTLNVPWPTEGESPAITIQSDSDDRLA